MNLLASINIFAGIFISAVYLLVVFGLYEIQDKTALLIITLVATLHVPINFLIVAFTETGKKWLVEVKSQKKIYIYLFSFFCITVFFTFYFLNVIRKNQYLEWYFYFYLALVVFIQSFNFSQQSLALGSMYEKRDRNENKVFVVLFVITSLLALINDRVFDYRYLAITSTYYILQISLMLFFAYTITRTLLIRKKIKRFLFDLRYLPFVTMPFFGYYGIAAVGLIHGIESILVYWEIISKEQAPKKQIHYFILAAILFLSAYIFFSLLRFKYADLFIRDHYRMIISLVVTVNVAHVVLDGLLFSNLFHFSKAYFRDKLNLPKT